jgi:MOSC domain-containing protein YiiM
MYVLQAKVRRLSAVTFAGEVASIHLASEEGAPVFEVTEVRAVPGKGLEGDRYFKLAGTFSRKLGPAREVTLIEGEALDALQRDYGLELAPGSTRRNITTRGVPLNHLVEQAFRVGETVLRGIELCDPCSVLEANTQPGARKGLIHRGGLNAQVLVGGVIRVGDRICPADD